MDLTRIAATYEEMGKRMAEKGCALPTNTKIKWPISI
jgi:hypothetical protein